MPIANQNSRILRFGAFQVDLSSGELQKHGIKVRLQEQPFQVLAMLLDRPGQVVAREDLRKKLWPSDTFVDFEVGLNSAILRLRNALADSADKPRFVETLPRRGYRFIAAVHNGSSPAHLSVNPVLIGTEEPAEVVAPIAGPTPARRRLSMFWILVTAFALALVLLFAFNAADVRNRLLGKRVSPGIHSIAVLPLENLSGDPAQEFFADGMTDALITDLAQVDSLQVISRTSVMKYKGARKLLPQIAADLKVDAVVEGTVTRAGNRVRITAQLIDSRTDRHLWARTYERDLNSILALQEDVARGIANEIQAKLTPQQKARLTKAQPVNPAAYEAYVKGNLLLNRTSVEEANKALQYFQQAVAIDPKYATAYSGMAECYSIIAIFSGPKPETWQKAKLAANRALELDNTSAEAHRSLAKVRLWYDWDIAESEKENRRALQLNPGDAESYATYATMLTIAGRWNEGIAASKRGQELDPLSPNIAVIRAMSHFYAREYGEAIEASRKALELDPAFIQGHRWLGLAYEAQGKFPETIAEFKLTVELSPENLGYLVNLARVYARAGQKTEARRILAQLKEQSRKHYVAPVQLGFIHAALGEKDLAFAWIEKGYAEHNNNLLLISFAPWFDPLRTDPRFPQFQHKVELAIKRTENAAGPVSKTALLN